MSALASHAPRRAISPYARRLARDKGIGLELLSGSGPNGRIVAADVLGFVPRPVPAAATAPQAAVSAFATRIGLSALTTLIAGFAQTDTPFDLTDIALRAAGCALADLPDLADLGSKGLALEEGGQQIGFAGLERLSLTPIRAQRLAESADASAAPALLSLRLVPGSAIRPVSMPLKPGRALRLVVVVDEATAEILLSFDAALVEEDLAASLLERFRAYLEKPLRLLA